MLLLEDAKRWHQKSLSTVYIGASSLDDCSAQVFPYNIFAYCSLCRVDCKFARNKKKYIWQVHKNGGADQDMVQ
jgi:hypothetical protein